MRARRRRVALAFGLAALLAVLAGAGLWGGPAQAQEQGGRPELTVDRVDARKGTLVVDGTLVGAEPSAITVRVDGTSVRPDEVKQRPLHVVAVLDNTTGAGNAAVQLAVDGLTPFLPGTNGVASLTVLTTAGRVRQLGPFTSADAATTALQRVVPERGDSLTWDAVVRGAEDLSETDGDRAVVLVTTSPDASAASPSEAAAALRTSPVPVRVVALPSGEVDAAAEVVSVAGGSVSLAGTDAQLQRRLAEAGREVAGRFRLAAPDPAVGRSGDPGELTLSTGGTDATVEYGPGELRVGTADLAVGVEASGSLMSRLSSNGLFVALVALLGVVALIVAVWTLLSMVVPDENRLSRRLQAYEEPSAGGVEDEEQKAGFATVALLQRAVDITGEVAQKRGLLERLEVKLERANLPLRAAEALFFVAAGSVVLALFTLVVTRNPVVALIALALGVVVPQALLNARIRRRQKAFVAQLPDMLSLMAGTLRAGYSIGQGFEAVSTEIDDPMGRELRRVVSENRLGRPLDDALDAVAERMGSDDFAWAVMAIKIQREVGGNLAELLLTVSNTMTQRERLRRDVNTLTAEGRMSAIVLGLLPPGLGVVMFVMNPQYIAKLFEGGLGLGMLALAVVAMGIGFAWMQKIIKIEV